MGAFWIVKNAKVLHMDNENFDQTAPTHILVFSLHWMHLSEGAFSCCGSNGKVTGVTPKASNKTFYQKKLLEHTLLRWMGMPYWGKESDMKIFIAFSQSELLLKERICSKWKQILSLKRRPIFERIQVWELNFCMQNCLPWKKWFQNSQAYSFFFKSSIWDQKRKMIKIKKNQHCQCW